MSKQIIEEVLGKPMMKELWTSACPLVLPVIPQTFELPATIAPALYMLRWNRRRGKGNFVAEFGNPEASRVGHRAAKAVEVSTKLLNNLTGTIKGCEHSVERDILADLLLAYCFENKGRSEERNAPIQRVYPTHYFSSWIDLPDSVAHLRGVPELVVSTLRSGSRGVREAGILPVSEFMSIPLIGALGDGLFIDGDPTSRDSDRFDESKCVGIDQLLTIRVAECLGVAPNPVAGGSIPQFAIPAARAHREWYEDMNVFLRAYGHQVPRVTLVTMLETCLAVGLSTVYLATIELLREWESTGAVPARETQKAWPIFVDCSAGADRQLRQMAEESMATAIRHLQRVCVQFMVIKVLMFQAKAMRIEGFTRTDNPLRDPIDSMNTLGSLLMGDHAGSQRLHDSLDEKCVQIAERLVEEKEESHLQLLEDPNLHPAWRLGEYVVCSMGNKLQFSYLRAFFDSCLMTNSPNGLAERRMTRQQQYNIEKRSVILSNTALDYLVHRHVRQGKKGTPLKCMSVHGFIDVLRTRYGFYISDAPRGTDTPSDLLRRNRIYLERRLRDLGLLAGVNDAEAMKRLRPRYGTDYQSGETEDGTDQDQLRA